MLILMDGDTPTILGTMAGMSPGTRDGTIIVLGTIAPTIPGDGRSIPAIGTVRIMAGGDTTGIAPGDGDTTIIPTGDIITLTPVGPITITITIADTRLVNVPDWHPTEMAAHVLMVQTITAIAFRPAVPMATVHRV